MSTANPNNRKPDEKWNRDDRTEMTAMKFHPFGFASYRSIPPLCEWEIVYALYPVWCGPGPMSGWRSRTWLVRTSKGHYEPDYEYQPIEYVWPMHQDHLKELAMFDPHSMREKLEALWRLDPTNCRPVEVHVFYSYLAWQREREKPRFWHYLQRARKEWRLPWR